MKKIKSVINSYIKEMSGRVIGIELMDSAISEISKNNKILDCDLLGKSKDKSSKGKGKAKKLYFQAVRRKYKKKRVNYIVGDIEILEVCKKTFISDSIYISKDKIIYYAYNDYDYNLFLKRYNRYKVNIEIIDCLDGKVVVIDTTKAKNNRLKDKFYYILDSLYDLIDIIGDILVS